MIGPSHGEPMIQVLVFLAAGAWAADAPKAAPEEFPVFEISVHAVTSQKAKDARQAVEKRLKEAGGAEVLTGAERKVAFSFGRAVLRGIDALADFGSLRGEKETLNPSLDARKERVAKERAELAKERAGLAAALARAPQARALIDKRLAYLEAFDPSKEERQSVLVVVIEAPAEPK
ncbi:MAG: hypothetical protein NTX64_14665 [Elusimicrobia bacterium]|nr:hypothetical protein [Elusimicrobiota bacterium]